MKIYTSIAICLLLVFSNLLLGQNPNPFIHVDQFGYHASATKVAVLSDPQTGYNSSDSYTPSPTLEIRDASTNAVISTKSVTQWNSGNTHSQSGDRGWWLDFSDLSKPGEYYIHDVANNESSGTFKIGYDVYNDVMKAATKMFYYNRCNHSKAAPYAATGWTDGNNFQNSLQDANCRYIYDPTNAALEKDLTGGWFDAGDYNKYVTFTHNVIHNMLSAYEENPQAFGDDWNIPESGNGIPDILDEIKWELDWLIKMNNADGSTHIKMGSSNYSDNTSAPPSLNTDQRYYGPTCSSASITIASVFAHASKVYDQFPSTQAYAATLLSKSETSFAYFKILFDAGGLETNCDDGSIISGDADRNVSEQTEDAVTASAYLFELTGNNIYDQFFKDNYASTEPINSSFWSAYKPELNDALLLYTNTSGADATISTNIINSITTAATNNWNGFYGFNTADLYRAFMPDWAYHWGSNRPKAGFGILNLFLVHHGINPGNASDYELKAKENLHYFHGVNPQGMVQLSNMYDLGGDYCVNEIYHTWFNDGTIWDNAQTSTYGPPPGFVTGGANKDFTVNTISPPYGQPIQKSYLDFNDGFPSNSWEISEPAIYYQAAYIRFLANYVDFSSNVDGDDLVDSKDADDDNDGLIDLLEVPSDPDLDNDNDLILAWQDDDDNDKSVGDVNGIPESGFDFDNDGIPNHLDIDADNDGIPDNVEIQSTAAFFAAANNCDTDRDGLLDSYDADCNPCGTVTGVAITAAHDTEGQELPDFLDTDADNDGVSDRNEAGFSSSNPDTDNDGLIYGDDELGFGANPAKDEPMEFMNNGTEGHWRNSAILPVELSSFTAISDQCDIILKWTTASELNNSHFIIEYSEDGNDFEAIGYQEGNGTTSENQNYIFIHENSRKKYNYYRLKQVDYDGAYEYSNILQVISECNKINNDNIIIYPNPTLGKTKIEIYSEVEKNVVIQLLDIYGKIILENTITIQAGVNINEIDLSEYQAGNYTILLKDKSNIQAFSIVRFH